jgi:RNA polymerase sigma-70 factor (ECF subfamily)
VQGAETPAQPDIAVQRKVVDAFLAALRRGDFEGLLAVLDPNVVVHIDESAGRPGGPREIHGAEAWAKGAVTFAQSAGSLEVMLIDGTVGLVWAPGGRPSRVLRLTIEDGKIVTADIIADPARLRELHLTTLNE